MHVRLLRVSVLVPLLLGVFFALLVSTSGGAQASPAGTSVAPAAVEEPECVKPKERDDDTIHVQGCLRDKRGGGDKPVPGVTITVEDDQGKVVGTGETDETGLFDIPLPGSTIDVLGKTFTIKIDTKTLPEGTALQDPKQVSLKQKINLETDVFVTFPIDDKPEVESDLERALDLAVGGIVFSLCLAMAALGLSMIFGTTGLTNFAHGELITFGAIVAFWVDQWPGDITIGGLNITFVVAMVIGFVASGAFGWLNDKALWAPLRRRGTGLIAMMIVSIGLSIFLRNVYQYAAGANNRNYSQYGNAAPINWGWFTFTSRDVFVVVISVAVLGATVLALSRTRMGKATRAVADNPALSASSGIDVERVINVVWIGGAALAGLSGILLGLTQGFNYQLGFKVLLLVFAAVTLGGLGTIWGSIIGAFVIGIFIEVSTLFIPAELKYVGALVILILVLLVRPQGILGRRERIG
ncbi:branched-chain amino acid ABC transporter permease [Nocardioides guangzhouensis]|uniref:Branched-chain amino acid ABC transporter permease n=1 Tax=Nocardioides guangzhouensis TaxID=2497878 RepID=A0A4Q4ZBI8_9ACTN|nr:branched-chain amino acid ABC transporter permease [Nocardioides guangzhouensis]